MKKVALVVSHLSVYEVAGYAVSDKLIKKIAFAKTVKFKLYGKNRNIQSRFTKKAIKGFRYFYNNCIVKLNYGNSYKKPENKFILLGDNNKKSGKNKKLPKGGNDNNMLRLVFFMK